MLLLATTLAAQPYYYELSFIAQTTPGSGEDVGTISVQENGLQFSPLLIDYTFGGGTGIASTNTASALDANFSLRPPANPTLGVWGAIYPTGHLAIAKAPPNPAIDLYVLWNCIPETGPGLLPGWESYQNNWASVVVAVPGPPPTTTTLTVARPQTPLWSVPTLSGNRVMAMGVANGFPAVGQQPPLLRTSFLITAENAMAGSPVPQPTLHLVAYGLTDQFGALNQPAWVSVRQYWQLKNKTVVGMAISNGSIAIVGNVERTRNEIMLVVRDNQTGAHQAHSTYFDIRTATFGPLDPGQGSGCAYPSTPFPLGTTAFGGISIARNTGIFMNPTVYSHDIAISMASASTTIVGTTWVFRAAGTQPPTTIPVPYNVGGGQVCHIPGSDPGGGGVALQVFGGTNPFGWYVVSPTGPGAPKITALNSTNSGGNFFYQYPTSAIPNGPPMCHPGGFTKIGASQPGMLVIPYSLSGTPGLEFVDGASLLTPVPLSYTVLQAIPPAQSNHTPTPPGAPPNLPKQGSTWPANTVIGGAAFLSEYGLYLPGY